MLAQAQAQRLGGLGSEARSLCWLRLGGSGSESQTLRFRGLEIP